MKIKRISLWQVALTSHETYYMADGKTCDAVTSTILRVETDTGLHGWGEVCPIPHYLPAYANGVPAAIKELSEVILGADFTGPEAMMQNCDACLQGHVYAKSALDMAFWDILGKQAELPLYSLLGGLKSQSLPLYHSITCIAPDDMVEIAKEAKGKGMTQFQVKLGADGNFEADIERLRKIRAVVEPGHLVYGDWNCGADKLTATRVARAVADIDVMLEQPCPTISDCAEVKRATGLPMKMDENVHDFASLLEANNAGCMQAAALKLSKFGGVSALRQARDLCTELGVMMCVEDTWGSDIATAAALHVAASTNPKFVMNTCDLSGYVAPRIAPSAPNRENGRIRPPSGPGLGITPDLDVLGAPLLELD